MSYADLVGRRKRSQSPQTQAVCGLLLVHTVAAALDGGWHTALVPKVPAACNMDVVTASELPFERFQELYTRVNGQC